MPPASNKPHSAGKYSGLASNLAHLGRMRLSPGQGAAARWQMILQVEQGGQQLTSERRVHPQKRDASSGVGNSSAQTVDAHVPREWEEPASEALRGDGAKRKSVRKRLPLRGSRCVGDSLRKPLRHHREAAAGRETARLHREATPQRKARHLRDAQPAEPAASGRATCRTGTFGTSNLPNQQHREEHFLANNGAKRAGAEGVRGSNLACFLKNFVSNYIVIFLMMLFRVHL